MNGNRTIISEETLLALADGDLQGEEAAAIEAAVSQDPALRDALRRLRLSSTGIAQAFDQTLDEPVPERLLAAARGAGSQKSPARAPSSHHPLGLGARCQPRRLRHRSWQQLSSISAASGGYIPAAEAPSDPLAARFEVTLQSALDNGTDGQIFPYASPDIGQGTIKLGSSIRHGLRFGMPRVLAPGDQGHRAAFRSWHRLPRRERELEHDGPARQQLGSHDCPPDIHPCA